MRAWAGRDSFEPGTNLAAWAQTILNNAAREGHRGLAGKMQRATGSLDESLDRIEEGTHATVKEVGVDKDALRAITVQPRQDDHIALLQAIDRMNQLPPAQSITLRLVALEAADYDEVAAERGITRQSVKRLAQFARKNMQAP